ncbi:MAG: hypothetical protein AAFN30_19120 [Actinomycetota bacterium]
MRFRHPGTDDLRRWLADDDEADDGVTEHIDGCARCAALMEQLETQDESSTRLGDALSAALAPPTDLTDRLIEAVSNQVSSRQMLGVVADIFGAGLQTSRMLLVEEINEPE